MITDPEAKQAYMSARDALAELRRTDKTKVVNMRKAVADLPKEKRQEAWNLFWGERTKAYQEMRQVDAASLAIQQGDPNALVQFQQATKATGEVKTTQSVYDIANEFGIPSATASGARNDRRILATVNKYARSSEASKIPIADSVKVPRSELPPEVSDRFAQEAKRLASELSGGEAGKQTAGANFSSTNVDWYKELYQQGLRKPAIDKALDKIIMDQGADKGVTVEKLKDVILGNFKFGDEASGTPPDLFALQELGASKQTMQKALDAFNDITKQELSLSEALKASGSSAKKFTNVADIPPDVARAAFEARTAAKGTEQAVKSTVTPNFIADVNKVIPNPQPIDLSLDMMAYGRQYGTLDSIVDGAKAAAKKQPSMLSDLPQNLQDEVMRGVKNIKNDFSSTRYQATKFGEWRRDSALLNYSRRTNFDSYLGNVAPFAFWSTSSMFQWAVESVDRPAMLTTYLRMKKLMATAGLERDGMASRTKGKIRIDLPFAPEWMGEQFIDPLRIALPFDNWIAPFDQFKKDQEGAMGRTQRVLDQLLADGKVSQEDYDEAKASQGGATWDLAESMMQSNDESDRYDAWDFGTALASPHAPIMWAYNAAFGDKADIGPFSPLSRIMRNAATQMGVEDWNNSKYNLEAKVRRQMGLNSYDKWDDYRIKRAASDMAGDGTLTPDEAKEAIAMAALVESGKMTPEDAKNKSEAYRLSVARSNQEYTGGPGAFALGLLGISVTSVPQGENNLRALQDDFGLAYQKYDAANDSLTSYLKSHPNMDQQEAALAWEKANPKLAKDGDALTDFFNENPEYETRLGLFDSPEETVHKFYIDQVWKTYNELPKVNQDAVREHLGTDFQESFMNKETRSYDDIPVESMAIWLKMMNVTPLGGLTADQRVLVSLYGKVSMTEPETAWRTQVFYDNRKQQFPEFYKLQSDYFKLPDNQRKSFLKQNQQLQQYWDYRKQFMKDNPDLVPYLTDNEKDIDKAKKTARTQAAVPTVQELNIQVTPTLGFFLGEYANGDDLPPEADMALERLGQQYNMSGDQVLKILMTQQGQQP
jgi:hypothetical protein